MAQDSKARARSSGLSGWCVKKMQKPLIFADVHNQMWEGRCDDSTCSR
ncbi:hypothetical protein KVH01_06555 [Pseudomonas sp. SWRI124]|nr:hypothetical protein [Pseudomonas khavaziana]